MDVFIGHALLAFAIVALVADWRGWSRRRALTVGLVAGAFGAIPDIDIAHAAIALDVGKVRAEPDPETFWDATRVHRTITHSLVVGAVAGPAFGLWAVRHDATRRWAVRGVAAAVLVALVGVAYAVSGPPGGVVMGLFVLAGAGIATVSPRLTDLHPGTVALAATAGLLLHPWGDLVTGTPPGLFYPFEVGFVDGRVLLHADPTVHLLGAFALELAAVWLAALAVVRTADLSLRELLDRRAAIGLAYGAGAVLLTPPTLATSYHFVFSILSVGLVCGMLSTRSTGAGPSTGLRRRALLQSGIPRPGRPRLDDAPANALVPVLTALAAITVALASYATVYLLLA